MHNHNGNKNNSMFWMMIPCLLLMGFLLFGGAGLSSSWYLWLIVIGVCVVPHIWMMLKGHGGHGNSINLPAEASAQAGDTSPKQPETKDENDKHKHGGCCH